MMLILILFLILFRLGSAWNWLSVPGTKLKLGFRLVLCPNLYIRYIVCYMTVHVYMYMRMIIVCGDGVVTADAFGES